LLRLPARYFKYTVGTRQLLLCGLHLALMRRYDRNGEAEGTRMRQTSSTKQYLTRRRFLGLGMAGLIASVAAACGRERAAEQAGVTPDTGPTSAPPATQEGRLQAQPTGTAPTATEPRPEPTETPTSVQAIAEEGRLQARPMATAQPTDAAPSGTHPLGLADERDALLYVPAGYQGDKPAPLVVLLHGAGGNAEHGLSLLQPLADEAQLILLAPPSRGRTWDVIIGDYGPDVTFIDRALQETFSRYAVDRDRLAIGGFSDGASYALSLGLINGDLFTHVIAFSPGFMAPTRPEGRPRFFISHGTDDNVLPIDRTSHRIVPQLQRAGYDVRYEEFDGPHTVPQEIAREAVAWFTKGQS
jgi:phospholipase/carboxylesterase